MEFINVEKMLDDASKIGVYMTAFPKTIFDVAGYPHYENVVSNILSFFFDANEEHGMSNLWLMSLLECCKAKGCDINSTDVFNNDIIHREYQTGEGKRIDILITTDSQTTILIENKIYASLDNDLKDYVKTVKKDFKDDEYNNRINIVLSLYEIDKQDEITKMKKNGFVNILYKDFLAYVSDNIGKYMYSANEKWLIYMKEFTNNLLRLSEGTMKKINEEWQAFLENNNTNICDFMDKYEKDINCKKKILDDARILISDRVNLNSDKVKSTPDIEIKNYNNNTHNFSGYTSIVVDLINSEKEDYVYEPYFMRKPSEKPCEKSGILYLAIWKRHDKPYNFEEIKERFSKKYPMAEINKCNAWGNFLLLKTISFKDYDEASFVQESVEIIEELKAYCSK